VPVDLFKREMEITLRRIIQAAAIAALLAAAQPLASDPAEAGRRTFVQRKIVDGRFCTIAYEQWCSRLCGRPKEIYRHCLPIKVGK